LQRERERMYYVDGLRGMLNRVRDVSCRTYMRLQMICKFHVLFEQSLGYTCMMQRERERERGYYVNGLRGMLNRVRDVSYRMYMSFQVIYSFHVPFE